MKELDFDILVNKNNPLPFNYEPNDLVPTDNNENNFHGYSDPNLKPTVSSKIYVPYINMKEEAKRDNIFLTIDSGYRSASFQLGVYRRILREAVIESLKKHPELNEEVFNSTFDRIYSLVAMPGCSEHQTGYAFDVASLRTGYYRADTTPEERAWLNENAYRYGFILRYPKGKEDITGFGYEPWHYRYVGTDISKELYNNGNWITLEEYHNDLKLTRKI